MPYLLSAFRDPSHNYLKYFRDGNGREDGRAASPGHAVPARPQIRVIHHRHAHVQAMAAARPALQPHLAQHPAEGEHRSHAPVH